MSRKREMNDPVRTNLMMDKNQIEELDKLVTKTKISRSYLIRVACDIFLRICNEKVINKDMRDSIHRNLKVIKPYGKFNYDEFSTKELSEIINWVYRGYRITVLKDTFTEIFGYGRSPFIERIEDYEMAIYRIIKDTEIGFDDLHRINNMIKDEIDKRKKGETE